jgi:nucleoside 2-deoxyribosyltransferase
MLVHFIASKNNLNKEIEDLRKIVLAIHKEGHVLTHDWLEPAYLKFAKTNKKDTVSWKEIISSSIKAIPKCDVLIAEVTAEDLEVGYEIGAAVSQKKPILLLRKEGSTQKPYLEGLEHHYIKRSEYNDDNLNRIVESFLKENDMPAKDMRFNFFIDRPIYNYLKWMSLQSGKTKAEILRELVLREIIKNEDL